jgi:hypothetical protein
VIHCPSVTFLYELTRKFSKKIYGSAGPEATAAESGRKARKGAGTATVFTLPIAEG